MAFPYRHFLVIGATAGIGQALSSRLLEAGAKVTVVGRRKDRLDEFVRVHVEQNARGVQFDISSLDAIPEFVAEVVKQSPDIDSIIFNAGIQTPMDLADPDKFNLTRFHEEVKVNFSSFVALTHAFLPYLLQNPNPTSFIFTGSNLAIIPAATLPAYSASKAALNVFTLCLREQLRNSSIKVLEISPPPVQTELHDYMGLETGRNLGMPLDVFIEQAYKGLAEGKDQIVIGSIGPEETFNEIIDKRRATFANLSKMMRGGKP